MFFIQISSDETVVKQEGGQVYNEGETMNDQSSVNKEEVIDETKNFIDERLIIAEEATPSLGETVEIDLKCAEKVTDSDQDEHDESKFMHHLKVIHSVTSPS